MFVVWENDSAHHVGYDEIRCVCNWLFVASVVLFFRGEYFQLRYESRHQRRNKVRVVCGGLSVSQKKSRHERRTLVCRIQLSRRGALCVYVEAFCPHASAVGGTGGRSFVLTLL